MPKKRNSFHSIPALASAALLAGCGASYEPGDEFSEGYDVETGEEIGSYEQELSAACGGEDSNALAAALAVAIGKELGRWDVNTGFQIVSGKLELSATGKLRCGSGCGNVTALLRLQDDASSVIQNHIPSTYRSKLTSWYGQQKSKLTTLVNDMLNVDEGVFRIRSKLSGKYIVPQNGATTNGAILEQSDQLSNSTAAQWRVVLKGTQRQLINQKSNMCMDLKSDTASGTNIVQRPCNAASTQGFRIGLLEAGVLTVRSKHNQALAVQSSSSANGADIMQASVRGEQQEKFVFEPYGGGHHLDLLETATAVYSLKVAHTGMGFAVSSASTNDGVSVVQQPFVATDDRFHWYVTQLGTGTVNGVQQTMYQFMNRRTGKCIDLDGKRLVQRTCSTSYNQRFMLSPTGNLRQVAYTANGFTVDVQNGSTGSGASVVESYAKTWQPYNMLSFEPILAIEPHSLRFSRKEAGGPCGDYYWYDVTAPNGTTLDDAASTYVQLIFAGGKQTPTGQDVNPFIAQKVSGNQVAIDPTYGLNDSRSTMTGACTVGCMKMSTSNVASQCCSCNGKSARFAKSAWSATTFICQ